MQSRIVLNISLLLLSVLLLGLGGCSSALQVSGDEEPLTIPVRGDIPLVYMGPLTEAGPLSPDWYRVDVDGRALYVFGEAVRPSIQSVFLLENTSLRDGETMLDIGTGSGIQALFAAWSGRARQIVATDIGKDAIKSARFNVEHYKLQDLIEVREGDLFEPLRRWEKFSLIINNINYPDPGDPPDHPLWEVHERFFAGVDRHLAPGGRIIYQSGHLDNIERIVEMARRNNFLVTELRMQRNISYEKDLIIYIIERDPFDVVRSSN